jgi:protein tyrosine/serine phosphatase
VESSTHFRKLFQRATIALGLVLATSCAGLSTIEGSDSWRSSQPSPGDLRFVAEQGVNSVICLRTAKPGQRWYDEEVEACRELGLNFRSLDWSARNESPEQIDRLVQALQELPPPYLIHCKHGIDRTGLAAAVFRVVALGHKKRDASSELSIWNELWPYLETQAMAVAWDDFRWPPRDRMPVPARVVVAP